MHGIKLKLNWFYSTMLRKQIAVPVHTNWSDDVVIHLKVNASGYCRVANFFFSRDIVLKSAVLAFKSVEKCKFWHFTQKKSPHGLLIFFFFRGKIRLPNGRHMSRTVSFINDCIKQIYVFSCHNLYYNNIPISRNLNTDGNRFKLAWLCQSSVLINSSCLRG